MTYNVFSGMLNTTQTVRKSIRHAVVLTGSGARGPQNCEILSDIK